jgi:hypothetical protein
MLRPEPVFRREGIEGQNLDADFPASPHGCPDRFRPFSMSGDTPHGMLLSPPAVSIHDDGDVAGQLLKVDIAHPLTGLIILCRNAWPAWSCLPEYHNQLQVTTGL